MRFRSWAVTHPGAVRTHNEDNFVDRPELGLWAVADGAGGHQSGEVASAAIRTALHRIEPGTDASARLTAVREAVAGAHAELRRLAADRGQGAIIACTVAVLLTEGDYYACLWAGDSRIYLRRGDALFQLTRDHSLVQDMIDAGVLTEEVAEHHPQANVITRAVGAAEDALLLEKSSGRIEPGDRFLLCSDGLFKALSSATVLALMASPADLAAQSLIDAALAAQARDNVTAIVVEAGAEA